MMEPYDAPISHAHPCNFRTYRHLDRGWGELAFAYRWDATDDQKSDDGMGCPTLAACWLFERTTYAENPGHWQDGYFYPPDPPFVNWRFRDPTDGRTAPVGREYFAATQGWAWDRHKLGGRLVLLQTPCPVTIVAVQSYCFHCELCGLEAIVPGPDAGPHAITRTFQPLEDRDSDETPAMVVPHRWRYMLEKHDVRAWMDIGTGGYISDSAATGFGPW